MSEYQTRWSQFTVKSELTAKIEEEISKARKEYASFDLPVNSHEYLGVVAELAQVFSELAAVIREERQQHPDCRAILEFHQSCVVSAEHSQEVYTFGLQVRRQVAGTERRRNVFISWIFDRQTDYTAENAQIDQFMTAHQIEEYDDGSGVRSRIEP